MSLTYRRLLFAFFVLLFCLLVPIVLLYANGYTVNWRRLNLEKTGAILIDSVPRGATVFLEGKTIPSTLKGWINKNNKLTTKTRVNNLAPGAHTVRLELDGYWPWESQINLAPEEALNFGAIRLFQKSEPELVVEAPEASAKLSSDGRKIAIVTKNKLTVFNTTGLSQQEIIVPKDLRNAAVSWSPNASAVSLGSLVIYWETEELIDLAAQTKGAVSLVHWDSGGSEIIYFLNNGELWSYDKNLKQSTNLDPKHLLIPQNEKMSDYYIKGRQIYIVATNSSKIPTLYFGSLGETLTASTLPPADYQFSMAEATRPILYDGHKLYAIDEPIPLFLKPRLLEITDNFQLGRWFNNTLVYATPLELRRWNGENDETLLTRLGSPIISVWPLETSDGIIITTAEKVQVYVSGRDSFALTLADITNSSVVTATHDGKTLYIYGNYKNRTGLFRLAL